MLCYENRLLWGYGLNKNVTHIIGTQKNQITMKQLEKNEAPSIPKSTEKEGCLL